MYKLLIGFVLCLNTLANFTGVWLGDGKFVTHKRQGECRDVFFKLQESETQFELVTGGYNCSSLSAEYPYSKFLKNNGYLLSEGKVVGSYNKDEFILFDIENQFRLTMTKDSKSTLNVKEEWGDQKNYLIIKSYLVLE